MGIPKGYEEITNNVSGVFVSDNKLVITGSPKEEDEGHNCDEMGCSSVSHVLYRLDINAQYD